MAELDKGIPQVGFRFKNSDEAWQFWVAYGDRSGFDVRKRYTVQITANLIVRQHHVDKFVPMRAIEEKWKVSVAKCFRPETRTDCKA